MSVIDELNAMSESMLQESLYRLCASRRWVTSLMKERPYPSESSLEELAVKVWRQLKEVDHLEAIGGHPRIGAKTASLMEEAEQEGMAKSSAELKQKMAKLNDRYFEKFGFIFLISATGKSAEEMFEAISKRVKHSRNREIRIAAVEQEAIMIIRLRKLLEAG